MADDQNPILTMGALIPINLRRGFAGKIALTPGTRLIDIPIFSRLPKLFILGLEHAFGLGFDHLIVDDLIVVLNQFNVTRTDALKYLTEFGNGQVYRKDSKRFTDTTEQLCEFAGLVPKIVCAEMIGRPSPSQKSPLLVFPRKFTTPKHTTLRA